jgi:GTP-binding protein HflX
LEEISDSDLLIHVVDASNPRAMQQIESVDKILTDLDLNEIPYIIALNKSDLVDAMVIKSLKRQIKLEKDKLSIAISAVRPISLKPLVERVGEILAKDLNTFAVHSD